MGIFVGYTLVLGVLNIVDGWYWTVCFYSNLLFLSIRGIEDNNRNEAIREQMRQQRQGDGRSELGRYESVMLDEDDDFGRWYDRERERLERESFLGDNNDDDDHGDEEVDIEQGGGERGGDQDPDDPVLSHWDIVHTDMPQNAPTQV